MTAAAKRGTDQLQSYISLNQWCWIQLMIKVINVAVRNEKTLNCK